VGRNESIGIFGTGHFDQLGGSHMVAGTFFLGGSKFGIGNGSGTYNLKFGSLAVGFEENIGIGGTGVFNQWGGTNTVGVSLSLGSAGSSGTYQLYGGRLQVQGSEAIGCSGTGVVTQFGGTHTVTDYLNLGTQLDSSGTYNLKFGTLAVSHEEIIGQDGTGVFNQSGGQHTVAGPLFLAFGAGSSGTYNLSGGQLSAGTPFAGGADIQINRPSGLAAGTFNVLNTITTVTGDVLNNGTVKTTNAAVTWNGNFTNTAAYISDPATQTFKGDLEVGTPGYLKATHSQDLFIIKEDFINNSTNTTAWDTAAATLKFATGTDKMHDFYIAGADHGSSYNYSNTEFSWGTLNILGQTVHLLDGSGTDGGAQYVKVLIGADVNYATRFVNNISEDAGAALNIYYDPKALANLYLLGLDYTFAGGGMLIADASVPLPPSVFLLGSGLLGLGLLGWRRRRG
jgi:hypothetical protein